jgi:hypothetical protein
MNKQETIKRIAAIESEAKELRKIVERGDKIIYDQDDKIIYDKDKIYIGIKDNIPYIMAGSEVDHYYRFHSFRKCSTEQGWCASKTTGQACLDYHITSGFRIYDVDNTKGAFRVFLNNL